MLTFWCPFSPFFFFLNCFLSFPWHQFLDTCCQSEHFSWHQNGMMKCTRFKCPAYNEFVLVHRCNHLLDQAKSRFQQHPPPTFMPFCSQNLPAPQGPGYLYSGSSHNAAHDFELSGNGLIRNISCGSRCFYSVCS